MTLTRLPHRLWLISVVALLLSIDNADGFVTTRLQGGSRFSPATLALQAKKKSGAGTGGKGFGKAPPAPTTTTTISDDTTMISPTSPIRQQQQDNNPSFLQSIEKGGSTNIPTMEPELLSPEERTKKLLREQYGMRTAEQQRMEESLQAQRKRMEDLKRAAQKDEDFDIMAILPGPLLKGIDTFLKWGVGICSILFITAGIFITAEAWSKTSGNPLPSDLDNFIVELVEPNFTPGLLVLLGFSVSLGAFAALQLGSASSQYKEK
jgi:hypothetical protein